MLTMKTPMMTFPVLLSLPGAWVVRECRRARLQPRSMALRRVIPALGVVLMLTLVGCATPKGTTQVQPQQTAFDNAAMQASDLRIADSALQGGDLDVALTIYSRLTQSHPTLIQAWTGLAAAHFLTGELEAAKMVYNEVLQRFPDQQLDARLGLARIALRHRRLPEAMAHYESILAQSPD